MSSDALLDILRGFLGIAVFTGIAVLLSENRRAIS
jgi:nucleoside permease NupC